MAAVPIATVWALRREKETTAWVIEIVARFGRAATLKSNTLLSVYIKDDEGIMHEPILLVLPHDVAHIASGATGR